MNSLHSSHSEVSFEGQEEMGDYAISDEEGTSQDKPTFAGLFKPHLFRTLLTKAKATANWG